MLRCSGLESVDKEWPGWGKKRHGNCRGSVSRPRDSMDREPR